MRCFPFVIGVMCVAGLVTGCGLPVSVNFLGTGGGGGGDATTSSGDGGSGGALFPTGGGGTGGAGPECAVDACVPSPAGPFVRITMVSIGKPEDVKPCPEWAPEVAFEGFAEMTIAPHTCAACSCGPAACTLPEAMHASAAKCPAGGAASIPWNAVPAWEGGCSAEDPIAAGLQCSGVPCVQSLTIDAPAVEPCKPVVSGAVSFPEPSWGAMARECKIHVDGDGIGCPRGESCAPVPPEGFVLCLSVAGDGYECPAGYPDPFVVFDSLDDARACSPCSCSDPEDADCAALVSAYSDGVCGQMIASVMVAPDQAACVDLLNGTGLASKGAELIVDKPGSCAPSGGEASGVVEPVGPLTLCCQKTDPEPPK